MQGVLVPPLSLFGELLESRVREVSDHECEGEGNGNDDSALHLASFGAIFEECNVGFVEPLKFGETPKGEASTSGSSDGEQEDDVYASGGDAPEESDRSDIASSAPEESDRSDIASSAAEESSTSAAKGVKCDSAAENCETKNRCNSAAEENSTSAANGVKCDSAAEGCETKNRCNSAAQENSTSAANGDRCNTSECGSSPSCGGGVNGSGAGRSKAQGVVLEQCRRGGVLKSCEKFGSENSQQYRKTVALSVSFENRRRSLSSVDIIESGWSDNANEDDEASKLNSKYIEIYRAVVPITAKAASAARERRRQQTWLRRNNLNLFYNSRSLSAASTHASTNSSSTICSAPAVVSGSNSYLTANSFQALNIFHNETQLPRPSEDDTSVSSCMEENTKWEDNFNQWTYISPQKIGYYNFFVRNQQNNSTRPTVRSKNRVHLRFWRRFKTCSYPFFEKYRRQSKLQSLHIESDFASLRRHSKRSSLASNLHFNTGSSAETPQHQQTFYQNDESPRSKLTSAIGKYIAEDSVDEERAHRINGRRPSCRSPSNNRRVQYGTLLPDELCIERVGGFYHVIDKRMRLGLADAPPFEGYLKILNECPKMLGWKTFYGVVSECSFMWFRSRKDYLRNGYEAAFGGISFVLQAFCLEPESEDCVFSLRGNSVSAAGPDTMSDPTLHVSQQYSSAACGEGTTAVKNIYCKAPKQFGIVRSTWILRILAHIHLAAAIKRRFIDVPWDAVDKEVTSSHARTHRGFNLPVHAYSPTAGKKRSPLSIRHSVPDASKPGPPMSTDSSKPGLPTSTDASKPGLPTSTDASKPGLAESVEEAARPIRRGVGYSGIPGVRLGQAKHGKMEGHGIRIPLA